VKDYKNYSNSNKGKNRRLTIRIYIVLSIFILSFFIIILKDYQIQILKGKEYKRLAERQYKSNKTLPPKRGIIYDRYMRELAVSVEVNSLYAQPMKIKDPLYVANALYPLINIDKKEIIKKLNSDKPFVWIKRQLGIEESKRLENLNIEGIGFVKESRRFYPNGELASHVLGFVGIDSRGLEGLEYKYNNYLSGRIKFIMGRDALGRRLFLHEDRRGGYSLVLTLDKIIQYIAERELIKGIKENRAKGGVVVVVNPMNGEILAMADYPQYNPNSFSKYDPYFWRNDCIEYIFEPGSTFKVFLVAAAIEERAVKNKELIFCGNGVIKVGNRRIHDIHPYKWLSVEDIIKYSSNIGAGEIGEKLGRERFYKYIKKFGFGEKTGIGLPGEEKGILRDYKGWSDFDLRVISFGQGISVTPIQLVAGFSAIANGGNLVKPLIVKRIINDRGDIIKEFKPRIIRRVISKRTAYIVKKMLKKVIEKGGTGERAYIKGYGVGGKTGTAQKVSRYGYLKHRYISSFVGFLPLSNPKFAIIVVIDEPQKSIYGGTVAAPVFKRIAMDIIHYYKIEPKWEDNKKRIINISDNEKLDVEDNKRFMPNFYNMSIRKVLKKMKGYPVEIIGSGIAVNQYPEPDTPINGDRKYIIMFKPPIEYESIRAYKKTG